MYLGSFAGPSVRGGEVARSFVVEEDSFRRDGVKVKVWAGGLHYFRVPSAYWRDRMQRLKAMGMNAVDTYIPWNFHESEPGVYDFTSEMRDVATFLRIAHEEGLMVLARIGPYICGEWDSGALPSWLYANSSHDVQVRSLDPAFFEPVARWWGELLATVVRPLLWENGGPVVMVQVENEFGAFGNTVDVPADRRYMESLVSLARLHLGSTVVLYTVDMGDYEHMRRGSLPGSDVLTTGDFAPRPPLFARHAGVTLEAERALNPPGKSPRLISELYSGWSTPWGAASMHNSSGGALRANLASVLARDASFSLYMAAGGTNFGWWAGASAGGLAGVACELLQGGMHQTVDGCSDQFIATSYDFAAALGESAHANVGEDGVDKFALVRDALSAASETPLPKLPAPVPARSLGAAQLTQAAPLLSAASLPSLCGQPGPGAPGAPGGPGGPGATAWLEVPPGEGPGNFEKYNIAQGLALFRFSFAVPLAPGLHKLSLPEVHDAAYVFLDGRRVGFVGPAAGSSPGGSEVDVQVPSGSEDSGHQMALDILVENRGRFHNLGWWYVPTDARATAKAKKGFIGGPLRLDGRPLLTSAGRDNGGQAGAWRLCALPLAAPPNATAPLWRRPAASPALAGGPLLLRGTFQVEGTPAADTFAWLSHFGRGAVWVNGYALGRFSAEGPQHDLYVPAPWLREGANEIVLLDLEPPAPLRQALADRGAQAIAASDDSPLAVPLRASRLWSRPPSFAVDRAVSGAFSGLLTAALLAALGLLAVGLSALFAVCLCGGGVGSSSERMEESRGARGALLTTARAGHEGGLERLEVLSLDPELLLDTPFKQWCYAKWQLCARCIPAFVVVGMTLTVLWFSYWDADLTFAILSLWYVYLLVHTVRVAVFGALGLRRLRRDTQTDWQALLGEEEEEAALKMDGSGLSGHWNDVLHLVFMPNYKEEIEILQEALDALACTPGASQRLGICLAMEEREVGSREKAAKLEAEYGARFRFVAATYHPADLPNERPGKCSNMAWAFPRMREALPSKCPNVPEPMVITTVIDADSELHPCFFDYLTYAFLKKDLEARRLALWQPAVMHFKNYRRQPWLVRIMSVFCSINELASLADPLPPNGYLVTYSTYSLSLELFAATGGVDPFWIAEDWHCTIKAVLKTCGAARCEPVYLPVCNYTPEGATVWETLYLRWDQGKRHMLGVTEVVYVLWSTWLAFLELPTLGERCRFCCRVFPMFWKICHVHMVAGLGFLPLIGMVVGVYYQFSAWCDMGVAPNPLVSILGIEPVCLGLTAEHLSFGTSARGVLDHGWLAGAGLFGAVSAAAGVVIDLLMVQYYDEFGGSSFPGAERGTGGAAEDEGKVGRVRHFGMLFAAMAIAGLPSSILLGYVPEWIAVLSVAWRGCAFTHARSPKKVVEAHEE